MIGEMIVGFVLILLVILGLLYEDDLIEFEDVMIWYIKKKVKEIRK